MYPHLDKKKESNCHYLPVTFQTDVWSNTTICLYEEFKTTTKNYFHYDVTIFTVVLSSTPSLTVIHNVGYVACFFFNFPCLQMSETLPILKTDNLANFR